MGQTDDGGENNHKRFSSSLSRYFLYFDDRERKSKKAIGLYDMGGFRPRRIP